MKCSGLVHLYLYQCLTWSGHTQSADRSPSTSCGRRFFTACAASGSSKPCNIVPSIRTSTTVSGAATASEQALSGRPPAAYYLRDLACENVPLLAPGLSHRRRRRQNQPDEHHRSNERGGGQPLPCFPSGGGGHRAQWRHTTAASLAASERRI
jgi:hypothetical protein